MVFFASVQGAAEAEKGFDISPPGGYNKQVFTCGVSTSVVRRLPKPNRRVRLPYPAPRRNGLRSIQKARSQDRAFLILLCHSSFSPRNFALQTSAGAGRFAACYRKRHIACDDFLSKSSRAHSAAPHFPTKLCFANFRGAPGRFAACYRKCHIPCGGFCKKPPCALCPAALAGGKAQTSPCLRRFFKRKAPEESELDQ